MTEKTTFHPTDIVTYRKDHRNVSNPRKYLTMGGQYEVVRVRSDDRYIQVRNDTGLLTIVDRMRFDLAIARHEKTITEVARKRRKEAEVERKAKAKAKREAAEAAKVQALTPLQAMIAEADRLGLAGLIIDRGYLPKEVMTAPYGKSKPPLLFTSVTHEDIYAAVANYVRAKFDFNFKVVDLDKTTEGFRIAMEQLG